MGTPNETRLRRRARITLACLYLLAGVLHLMVPRPFLHITPVWVPYPALVIAGTGLCEIAGALALLTARLRKLAGVMLALYALCVFPANLQHAVQDLSTCTGLGWAYHAPRLFVQPLLCWWALWAGGVRR
ncbi:DoxX family protein [uncultured Sphingomonas sp.]|uniref:DoxX family protein n=1 Tax=uncultured Sphingomonas sp. TaxID=158754 RepID=UPI0025E6579B|nr:DoxX family protein [uncultured Sphingomonas sp.]